MLRIDEIKWKEVMTSVTWKIVLFVKRPLCLQINIFDVCVQCGILKAK